MNFTSTELSIIEWQNLGLMPYAKAWELQERLRDERIEGKIADRILLLEHPPVITMGRKECSEDVLSPESVLASEEIELIKVNRGGRATYHGPGQLVCYFICELASFGMGIKDFVRAIEEICILTLADFGVTALRDPDHPGLWVGQNKIVAIGLNIAHGVTQHGFAMNVNCDLGAYRHIIACGIQGRGVTSIARETGRSTHINEITHHIITHASTIFSREITLLKNE